MVVTVYSPEGAGVIDYYVIISSFAAECRPMLVSLIVLSLSRRNEVFVLLRHDMCRVCTIKDQESPINFMLYVYLLISLLTYIYIYLYLYN